MFLEDHVVVLTLFCMCYFLSFVSVLVASQKITISNFLRVRLTLLLLLHSLQKTKGGLSIDAKDKTAKIYHVDLFTKIVL